MTVFCILTFFFLLKLYLEWEQCFLIHFRCYTLLQKLWYTMKRFQDLNLSTWALKNIHTGCIVTSIIIKSLVVAVSRKRQWESETSNLTNGKCLLNTNPCQPLSFQFSNFKLINTCFWHPANGIKSSQHNNKITNGRVNFCKFI